MARGARGPGVGGLSAPLGKEPRRVAAVERAMMDSAPYRQKDDADEGANDFYVDEWKRASRDSYISPIILLSTPFILITKKFFTWPINCERDLSMFRAH